VKNKSGFTLIELMVVISIIALLSSVVLAVLNDARAKGRDAARIRALKEVSSAINMYFNDKGTYPPSQYNVVPLNIPAGCNPNSPYNPATGDCQSWITALVNGNYIKYIPKEIRYRSIVVSTGGTCASASGCTGYTLAVKLEKQNPILKSDSDINVAAPTLNHQPDGISKEDYCNIDSSAIKDDTDLCYDLTVKN